MRLTQFKKPLYLFRGSPVPTEWDDYDDADLIRRIVEGKAEVSTIGFISDAEPPSDVQFNPVNVPSEQPYKPNRQTRQQEEFEENERQKQLEKERIGDEQWKEEERKRLKQIALNMLESAYIKAMLDDDTLY